MINVTNTIRLREEIEGHATVFIDDVVVGICFPDVADDGEALAKLIKKFADVIANDLLERFDSETGTQD